MSLPRPSGPSRLASGLAHEAVSDRTGVTVESGDNSACVDADAAGSLTCLAPCAWDLESRNCPIGGAHEAVIHKAGINVGADNSSRCVDTNSNCPLIGFGVSSARSV